MVNKLQRREANPITCVVCNLLIQIKSNTLHHLYGRYIGGSHAPSKNCHLAGYTDFSFVHILPVKLSVEEFQMKNASEIARYVSRTKKNKPYTKSRHSDQSWLETNINSEKTLQSLRLRYVVLHKSVNLAICLSLLFIEPFFGLLCGSFSIYLWVFSFRLHAYVSPNVRP